MRFQLDVSPLTKPAMITKPSTTRLMPVKILFTNADSLTPNARSPEVRGCSPKKKKRGRGGWGLRGTQRDVRILISAALTAVW